MAFERQIVTPETLLAAATENFGYLASAYEKDRRPVAVERSEPDCGWCEVAHRSGTTVFNYFAVIPKLQIWGTFCELLWLAPDTSAWSRPRVLPNLVTRLYPSITTSKRSPCSTVAKCRFTRNSCRSCWNGIETRG